MFNEEEEDQYVPDKQSMLTKKQRDNMRQARGRASERQQNRRVEDSDEEGSENERRKLVNSARQGTGADPIFSNKT